MTPVAIRTTRQPLPTSREQSPRAGAVDDVELNSDASFPASDAPSWTPVARVGGPRKTERPAEPEIRR